MSLSHTGIRQSVIKVFVISLSEAIVTSGHNGPLPFLFLSAL